VRACYLFLLIVKIRFKNFLLECIIQSSLYYTAKHWHCHSLSFCFFFVPFFMLRDIFIMDCNLWLDFLWSFFPLLLLFDSVIQGYVARTRQHWNGHDTRTHDEFLKIHMTRVRHVCETRHGFMIGVSVLHRLKVAKLYVFRAALVLLDKLSRVIVPRCWRINFF